MCCNHSNRHIRRVYLHPLDEFEAVAIGQPHIGQAQIILVRGQLGFRARHIACGICADIHAPERQRQELADIRFVIDNQSIGLAHW